MCFSSAAVIRRCSALAAISFTSSTPASAAMVRTASMIRPRMSGAFIVGSGIDRSSKAMVSFIPALSSAGSGSESSGLSNACWIASSTSGTAGIDSGG
jgi:hypothetical protein